MTKSLEDRVAALEAAIESLKPVDLSDKYADFVVRKSPPNWITSGGHDYSGELVSKTSPEFCDALASFLDWQASKDEEQKKSYVNAKGATVFPAVFARKDAGRARAWAKRMRETAQPAVANSWTAPRTGTDDGIPF